MVSAPSGAGKTTVVERLIAPTPGLGRSRSFTSRRARPGEADGVDYNFVSRARFEAMIAGGQFLEWAEYRRSTSTARPSSTPSANSSGGTDLVLVIDVQGARQVRRHRSSSVLVFVLPPSAEVLEARLRGRGEDTEEQIRRRLQVAREEVRAVPEYDYVVVNDDDRRLRRAPPSHRPGRARQARGDERRGVRRALQFRPGGGRALRPPRTEA